MESVLLVSEVTQLIKRALESDFRDVTIEGEVSNFRPAASGHWYFSLKDDDAVLACVMFRGSRNGVSSPLRDGDLVRARGDIGVYPPRGTYQLVVRSYSPIGSGRILAMLDERKRRFEHAGLFANTRPLPAFPSTIAVVTSPTGAAIRDIIRVLTRRDTPVALRIIPVPVQGAEAHRLITRAIEYVGEHALGDTIIVTRGGGSIEDLLPFSEESVVRAIHRSPIPVISAVGHEIDWALSDFAADHRAPTPSAAAQVVAPSSAEVHDRIRAAMVGGINAFLARTRSLRYRTERFSTEELRYRFRNFTAPWYQRLDEARLAIDEGMRTTIRDRRSRLQLVVERIDGASPYRALRRGYAIVRKAATDEIVTRRSAAADVRDFSVQFDDGAIDLSRTVQEEQ